MGKGQFSTNSIGKLDMGMQKNVLNPLLIKYTKLTQNCQIPKFKRYSYNILIKEHKEKAS